MTQQVEDPRRDKLERALVDLSGTTDGSEPAALMTALGDHCRELFDLASVGVMLSDDGATLEVVSSSDESGHTRELLELQSQEGPCQEAYRLRTPVRASGVEAARRWPAFSSHAESLGYRSFTAVPMRLREQVIGALNLFSEDDRVLDDQALREAQALADAASIGLLHEKELRAARVLAEQLQQALSSRVVLEQAKGAVASSLRITVDQAFVLLRTYARNHNLRLGNVAREVLEGALEPAVLELSRPR